MKHLATQNQSAQMDIFTLVVPTKKSEVDICYDLNKEFFEDIEFKISQLKQITELMKPFEDCYFEAKYFISDLNMTLFKAICQKYQLETRFSTCECLTADLVPVPAFQRCKIIFWSETVKLEI